MTVSLPSPLKALVLVVALILGTAFGAEAQSGYRIQAGDTLSVEVLEDGSLNRSVLVLPDGSINFPLAGTLRAGGRTSAQVQQQLAAALAPNFAVTPNVFVSVASLAPVVPPQPRQPKEPVTQGAFIMGEVNSPGRFDVEPGTTLLQLLAQAGGLTRFAAETRIELRRTHPKSGAVTRYLFSYSGKAKGPRISGGTQLIDGDVVVVPERRLFE